MSGRIDHAKRANELAVVMARETAYIAKRDPLKALLQNYTAGPLSGSNLGFGKGPPMTGQLMAWSCSRDIDREADGSRTVYLDVSVCAAMNRSFLSWHGRGAGHAGVPRQSGLYVMSATGDFEANMMRSLLRQANCNTRMSCAAGPSDPSPQPFCLS